MTAIQLPFNAPWGKSNSRRGAPWRDVATRFIRAYPIGSEYTSDEFGEWAVREGLLTMPEDLSRESYAWKGYVCSRNELHGNIRNSGLHPAMNPPFAIIKDADGKWHVLTPEVGVGKVKLAEKVIAACDAVRQTYDYLMQSTDWPNLPVELRVIGETSWYDVEDFRERIEADARRLTKRFDIYRRTLEKGIASGEIPLEGREIQEILALSHEEIPPDEDDVEFED